MHARRGGIYAIGSLHAVGCAAAGARGQTAFVDDAILIEKYYTEFKDAFWTLSTAGSISVHVNANRQGEGGRNDHWLDFAVGWCGYSSA